MSPAVLSNKYGASAPRRSASRDTPALARSLLVLCLALASGTAAEGANTSYTTDFPGECCVLSVPHSSVQGAGGRIHTFDSIDIYAFFVGVVRVCVTAYSPFVMSRQDELQGALICMARRAFLISLRLQQTPRPLTPSSRAHRLACLVGRRRTASQPACVLACAEEVTLAGGGSSRRRRFSLPLLSADGLYTSQNSTDLWGFDIEFMRLLFQDAMGLEVEFLSRPYFLNLFYALRSASCENR